MAFLKKSWSVILVVPLLATVIIALVDDVFYPLLTHEEFRIMMGQASAIKGLAVITAFLMAYAVAKLYQVSFANLLSFWILLTGIGLFTDAGNYEGSQQSALALHLFVYQMGAILATMVFTVIRLNQRLDHLPNSEPET
jgi:hypothetical protein